MNGMTLTIKGLFGHFNYEIPLYGLESVDGIPMSDGVTILTGPNGYGKSTILRILEAISKDNAEFFHNLKFEELTLLYDKTECLSILKPNQTTVEFRQSPRQNVNNLALSFEDIAKHQKKDTHLLFDGWKGFPEAFMIPEQRLLRLGESSVGQTLASVFGLGKPVIKTDIIQTATEVPEKMRNHISDMSNRYSETDAKLNASFPSRLLNQSGDDRLTEEEFNRLYQDMNDKLRVLRENGLSDVKQQDIPVFQADKAGILRIFFEDFDAKYQEYEPLIAKLTLFRKILARRFRTFKRVEVSREYGLRVLDIPADKNGKEVEIPLEKLSSGEQETLVLYYQLIFETAPGTILLIDEPEISLHIAWQRHFIDELKEIVRLNDLRAVVATHSSSIIGRHRDIQVDLGALYQDELDR